MKKIINEVENVVSDSIVGFGSAHSNLVSVSESPMYVTRKVMATDGKVVLISGGGSGHEPLHAGFVGVGMLDAACPGEVFTSPTPDQMMAAAEATECGGGVLWIVKNYAGDVMNFEMAAEMVEGETATVLTDDDVAVESSLHSQGRRGVAGTIVVEKVVGAAAERGWDLESCRSLGERINKATGTMGMALDSCVVPAAGSPTFQLGKNEFEWGVGIHGEPGRERRKLMPATTLAEMMVDAICNSIKPESDQEVLVIVNGMGGTPLLELYLLYESVRRSCMKRSLKVVRSLVGNYCTSLEMAGASVTLTKLDPEAKDFWDAPVRTASFNW